MKIWKRLHGFITNSSSANYWLNDGELEPGEKTSSTPTTTNNTATSVSANPSTSSQETTTSKATTAKATKDFSQTRAAQYNFDFLLVSVAFSAILVLIIVIKIFRRKK